MKIAVTPGRVTPSLVLMFCRSLFVALSFSFVYCVVYSSSIYSSDYLPLVSSNSSSFFSTPIPFQKVHFITVLTVFCNCNFWSEKNSSFGTNRTKGPKQDSQNQIRLLMPEGGEP